MGACTVLYCFIIINLIITTIIIIFIDLLCNFIDISIIICDIISQSHNYSIYYHAVSASRTIFATPVTSHIMEVKWSAKLLVRRNTILQNLTDFTEHFLFINHFSIFLACVSLALV